VHPEGKPREERKKRNDAHLAADHRLSSVAVMLGLRTRVLGRGTLAFLAYRNLRIGISIPIREITNSPRYT
jgi:hypothetical protein